MRGRAAAQYALLCREDGGVLDDLITYRLGPERYLTVTNAANHQRDLEWFQQQARAFAQAQVSDVADRFAMLAVQGPAARAIVQGLADEPLPARMRAATRTLAGVPALVCGTGYTGEDGVELMCAPDAAGALWDELLARGATPAGLGARDTLRIEACLPLYGNELTLERGPIEAGLGWACKEQTGFIGAGAVERARHEPPAEQLVAFTVEGQGIARAGNPVQGGGEVTSGTHSPCLREGVGMAYVPARARGRGLAVADRRPWQDARCRRAAQAALQKGLKPEWRRPAIQMSCSTTPNTTGPGSTRRRDRRPWGSPGTRRTRWARSCSSIRPPSAAPSRRTPPTPRSSP